jgi:hypothetical protein
MSKKKHIDELFKEQLQNFEAAPSPEVWNAIQAKMKKEKEDRKVIPIWWKLGGVAALLVLLLALNFVFQPFGAKDTPVIVTEDTDSLKEEATSPLLEDPSVNKDALSSEGDGKESTNNELDKSSIETEGEKKLKDQIVNDAQGNQKAITSEDNTVKVAPLQKNDLIKKNTSVDAITEKEAVAVTSEKTNTTKTTSEKDNPATEKVKDNNLLIKKDVSEGVAKKVTTGIAKTTGQKDKVDTQIENPTQKTIKEDNPLIQKDISVINKTKDAVAETDNKKEEDLEEKVETDPEDNKKSIFDAIEEDKEATVAKVKNRDLKNWEVTPNFGPVFYNSLNGGSSIDPAFADNAQSGDVNFSYGVQVSYAISDRLSLRSGVSNVDLGYTTGGVELATGPVAVALNSIDYGGRSVVLSAFDQGTLANLPPSSGENDPFAGLTPKSTSGNAELIQNLSYYEVPMELKYALFNKRFGVNMIGGFSTLFLGNNEISVRDGDFRDVLGEANNLNSVSFSTNFGLGFDYKISKRLKFNVEPMFKYQLNPYSDSSVDFKPYYFGVYSGLSFRF